MKPSKASRDSSRIAAIAILCVASLELATPARAAETVSVPAFKGVEVRNGAHVTLRHGDKRRVTVIQGSTTVSEIRVDEDHSLNIDRCPDGCSSDYKLEVEIVAPEISALAVADGGWLRCAGSFPSQDDLAAAVASGGTLDVRSMSVDAVAAAIEHGGRILTEPRETLTAAIAQGGAIIYWGRPAVQSAIQHGGVVSRGRQADRTRPFEQVGPVVED
jgi:hypothetical protein